jgi:hypothetical protein
VREWTRVRENSGVRGKVRGGSEGGARPSMGAGGRRGGSNRW